MFEKTVKFAICLPNSSSALSEIIESKLNRHLGWYGTCINTNSYYSKFTAAGYNKLTNNCLITKSYRHSGDLTKIGVLEEGNCTFW